MALVLSRKFEESIMIGDDIWVTVVRHPRYDDCVRLVITAPRNVSIVRAELVDRVDPHQGVSKNRRK